MHLQVIMLASQPLTLGVNPYLTDVLQNCDNVRLQLLDLVL